MHQAHPASGGRLQLLVVTHVRNIENASILCRAQNRLILVSLHSLAIDGEREARLPNLVAHHQRLRLFRYGREIISD
jgi:hypothetical protein